MVRVCCWPNATLEGPQMHMQDDFPLLLSTLYDHATWQYPDQEIVSVEADLTVHRTTYGVTDARVRKLATALGRLGIESGDAVATFAWNNHRHHELYWATANTGRICHTLNIRLFPDQLTYIVNHAKDKAIFIDPGLVPVVAPLLEAFTSVESVVIMGSDEDASGIPGAIAYEDLIADAQPMDVWPTLDEASPMMLCYTSGTTGHPKGVAYTQRSTYLHAISNIAQNPIGADDNVLPVVPMFHAAAWGYPFMATAMGSKLTYPGPDLSGKAITDLFVNEHVTFLCRGTDRIPRRPAVSRRTSRHRSVAYASPVLWWIGGPQGTHRLVRGQYRCSRCPGLGHDGDQPDRFRCHHQAINGGVGLG